MPAKRNKEKIRGVFFTWLLGQRNGVYFADGRSNRPPLGRQSLTTRDRKEALEQLKKLDRVMAVEAGIADRSILGTMDVPLVDLEDGRQAYIKYIERPRVVGGAKKDTSKRYRAVFDKFLPFAREEKVTSWNEVKRATLEKYAAFLDGEGYAYATEYLELTTLKQVVKWLVQEKRIPASCLIHLPLKRPQGTTTYCWRQLQVDAMLAHCRTRPDLASLAEILTALACTGLRISELASLRWSDVDLERKTITLTDESRHRKRSGEERRSTKSGRSRSFPIQADLLKILLAKKRTADGRVFHGVRDGTVNPDSIRNSLVRDVLKPLSGRFPKQGNVNGFIDGRLHSFRHYFCSQCANNGVPEQVVKEWLGHADSKMVRHYYHLHDDEAQRQMDRVTFFGSAGGAVAAGNFSGNAEGFATRPSEAERTQDEVKNGEEKRT